MRNTRLKRNIIILAAVFCSVAMVYANDSVVTPDSDGGQEIVTEKIKANKSTLEKAQESINSKDFAKAITYLTGYINSKPQKYEPYKLRGDAYYELRQYSLAKEDYQTAVNIKSSDDKVMTSTKYISAVILGADKNEQLQNAELGELYGRLMYAQKALNDPAYATSYENALKYNSHIYLPKPKKNDIYQINAPQKYGKPLNPQGVDAYIYGAIDEIAGENYNEALYKLQNVTSEYPNYYLGYYLTGVALSGLEKYEDAQKAFEKSISLNPNDFESYASLGQIYYDKAETSFSSSDAKKSIEYFNKALKLNPNCHLYYFYIALNNMQIGNTDLAISNFDKALSLNSNDYNSMYYKAIAEFNTGDYESVINLTTALLYKHVSNSNSVLYLRALAYYKQGNEERALSDLDTVLNNINDIYNADVKVVSEKEKTLNSYIHYLKSEMAHQYGYGAASDVDQAMQNPIIAQLAKAEKAMRPYEKTLSGDTISLTDYHKYEAFYNTGLPKLLNSGIVITERDIDNQYDYIRTTFGDLGIGFVYKNPDYKMAIIENYPYKKYSQKLNKDDAATLSSSVPQDVVESTPKAKTPELKTKTSAQEMIGDNSKVSLAQMIAANELPKAVQTKDQTQDKITSVPETEKSSNIADGEPFIFKDKKDALLNDKNSQQVNNILEEEKNIDKNDKKSQKNQNTQKASAPTKLVAEEFKTSDDIVIKYGKTDEKNNQVEKVNSKEDIMRTEKVLEEPASKVNKIVEKHANVNPEDYGVKPRKTLEVSEKDEVITLDPSSLEKSVEKIKTQEIEKPEENNVNVFNQPKSAAKAQIKERAVQLSQENEPAAKNKDEDKKAVPVVVVPEIKTSETPVSLRPKEQVGVSHVNDTSSANTVDSGIKSASDAANTAVKDVTAAQDSLNQKIKEVKEDVSDSVSSNIQTVEDTINEEQLKLDSAQAKAQLKAQKEQEKLEAKLNKQKLKEERAAAEAQAKALARQAKEEAKARAAQLKAEQELAKSKAKEEKERLKALAKLEKEKAKKEAKEKAKQLKAEREAAKAQAKAMKKKMQDLGNSEKQTENDTKSLENTKSDTDAESKSTLKKVISVFKDSDGSESGKNVPVKKTVIKSIETK